MSFKEAIKDFSNIIERIETPQERSRLNTALTRSGFKGGLEFDNLRGAWMVIRALLNANGYILKRMPAGLLGKEVGEAVISIKDSSGNTLDPYKLDISWEQQEDGSGIKIKAKVIRT